MVMRNSVLSALLLLLPGAFGGAAVQQPLGTDLITTRCNQTTALEDLIRLVGEDKVLFPSPFQRPCYLPGNESECSTVENSKTNDVWVSNQPGGFFYANWASCQAMGENCSLPLDKTGPTPLESTCHSGSVAKVMVNLTSMKTLDADISAVFNFAACTKMPLVIKNTGHDWKGRSSAPGSISLWTHHLRHPYVPIVLNTSFIPEGCTIQSQEPVLHMGPGETWEGAYDFADENGYAILGGTCGTVGVAGWLHGGGHSPLSPVHGMGVDNVRQIEIITPRGEKIVANECQNQDLFFAVRGGGGGTWGVVINITYKVLKKFSVQAFTADFTGLDNTTMHKYFDILTSNAIAWSQKGWGGYIKTYMGTEKKLHQYIEIVNPKLDATEAAKDMEPVTVFLADNNQNWTSEPMESWHAYFVKHLQPASAHVASYGGAVASRLLPADAFQGDKRDQLTNITLDLYNSNLNQWLMLVTPVNFTHTNTSALHPSWSNAIWSVRINAKWDPFYDEPTYDVNHAHFKRAHEALEPLRTLAPDMGISVQEADIWEDQYELGYWGQANWDRLKSIKADVDPDNLLTNYAAVGWNAADKRYRCYPTL